MKSARADEIRQMKRVSDPKLRKTEYPPQPEDFDLENASGVKAVKDVRNNGSFKDDNDVDPRRKSRIL